MLSPTTTSSKKWLSLVEFASLKRVSLSTLRRYIKANKIHYRLIGGKYYICNDGSFLSPQKKLSSKNELITLHKTVSVLQTKLRNAQEEIAELKTLIAFYEERFPHSKTLDA